MAIKAHRVIQAKLFNFFAVPPSIDDSLSSSDVTVREQNSVTLTCNATGTPPLTVRWRREDGKLININKTLAGNITNFLIWIWLLICIEFKVAEWEGSELELNKVNRFDMAAYLCIASNGYPPTVSKRIILTVECKSISFVSLIDI